MKSYFLGLSLSFLLIQITLGQDLLWHNSSDELLHFKGKQIIVDDYNNVYVVSKSTYDGIKVIAYDQNGSILSLFHDDEFWSFGGMSISEDKIVVGGGISTNNNESDILLRVYHPDGSIYTQYQYDHVMKNDWITDIQIEKSGNTYACGTVRTNTSAYLIILKFDSEYELLWSKTFGNSDKFTFGGYLCITENSELIVSTIVYANLPEYPAFGILTLSSDGEILHECYTEFESVTDISLRSMDIDNDDKAYLVGQISINNEMFKGLVVCAHKDSIIWSNYIDSDQGESIIADVACTELGSLSICGHNPSDNGAAYIARYSSNGEMLAENYISDGFSLDGILNDIELLNDYTYVAGSLDAENLKSDIFVACTDSNCDIVWSYKYNGYWNSYDAASKIGFDNDDDILITGYRSDSSDWKNYCITLKLSNPLSVEEISVSPHLIKVFPNPVSDHLYVNTSMSCEYVIHNYAGQEVQNGRLDGSAIETGDLQSGTYLLQLFMNEFTYNAKFVKK